MSRQGEPLVSRYLRFYTRTLGGATGRKVPVAYFYLAPPRKGSRPFFSARVEMPAVLGAVEAFGGEYALRGRRSLIVFGQEAFQRLVVYAGVRQFIEDGATAGELLEAIRDAYPLDVIFWYNAFVRAFDGEGFRGVRRVARAFRELYRF